MPSISLITNGHQPGDLVLPMARILHVPAPGTQLKDIDDLPYRLGGMAAKPRRAIAWKDRDGNTTLIAGLGVAEAAEIQDMAYALQERQQTSDYESQAQRRERAGLPTVEQSRTNIRQAMANKAAWYRRHAMTGRPTDYDPTERSHY